MYPARYMTEKVPTSDMGNARLGIMVAERLRRKRKMTSTTRTSATSSVIWTSWMDSLMEADRSYMMFRLMDAGISAL